MFYVGYVLAFLYFNVILYSSANFLPENVTLVHLFEWKWNDVALECERFLQHKGYNAIQISPPNENLIIKGRAWWERYQPVSYTLSTRSGTEDEFRDMTKRCANVGVWIFADAVINHMAGGNGIGTAGNVADAMQLKFPGVPYGPNDFHSACEINNYNNAENVRDCRLNNLRDLNQSTSYVREKIIEYMNHLTHLGVAGFRIDAAKHIWPSDLKYIYSKLNNLNTEYGFPPNTKPYIYQEVIDRGGEAVHSNEYTSLGHVTEFKYCNSISNVFKGNDKLTYLVNWGTGWSFMESRYAVVFVDNHDTQRDSGALTYKNAKQYKMANAFMLAHPYGTPKVMSSFFFDTRDQGPPHYNNDNLMSPKINPDDTCGNGYVCEHRWRQIYNMVVFRATVRGTNINNWWSNGDQQIAFCRGNKGFITFTNYGDLNQKLQTCLPTGQYCDVISGNLINGKCTGKVINVDSQGFSNIFLAANDFDGVIATHIEVKL